MRRRSRILATLLTAPLLAGGAATGASAQSTSWAAQLLVPPFASTFVSEWERNPQNLTLSLSYLGTEPVEYQIEGVIRGAARGEVARALSPLLALGGGPTTEIFTGEDLFDWDVQVRGSTAEQAFQSGVIPDDDYQICVRVLSEGGIQFEEACASFQIRSPEPPQLLFPEPGQGISAFQPTFQWTPVILPPELGIEYRVRIVERYRAQTPNAAIEANLPLFEDFVGEAPLFVYPVDALELEPGKEYVWQVEVVDGFGEPLIPGGLFSPAWPFTATTTDAFSTGFEEDAFPSEIPLVPGLATLTDLEALEVEDTPEGWRLNGQARISLDGPYGVTGRVRLEDLAVDVFGGTTSVADGRAVALLESGLTVTAGVPLEVTELVYTPFDGLTATAALQVPGGDRVPLEGDIQVTLGGLFGTVEAAADTLWVAGADPVELAVRSLSVTLPSGPAVLGADAEILGGAARCDRLEAVVTADGAWQSSPLCLPAALTGGEQIRSDRWQAEIQSVVGSLGLSTVTGALSYDLTADALVRPADARVACDADFRVVLANGSPVTTEAGSSRCDVSRSVLETEWLRLAMSDFQVAALDYTPGTGFGITATLDLHPSIPAIPELTLPSLSPVTLDATSVTFPAIVMEDDSQEFGLDGYAFTSSRMEIPSVTLDWDSWRSRALGDFRVELQGAVGLHQLSLSAPDCLVGARPLVIRGVIQDGGFDLQLDGVSGLDGACEIPLGPEALFRIEAWTGPVSFSISDGVYVNRGLGIRGGILLPEAFTCGTAAPAGERQPLILEASWELLPDGSVAGRSPTQASPCPLGVAGFELSFDEGEVAVALEGEPRPVLLTANARLRDPAGLSARARDGLAGEVIAEGMLSVDLQTGAVVDGSMVIPGPVALAVPRDEPVFTFQVSEMLLDADGLRVDGRQELLLDGGGDVGGVAGGAGDREAEDRATEGARMGVTFNDVLLDPVSGTVTSGAVLFDAAFALDAGIDPLGLLDWQAVDPERPFSLDSGFRVALPARAMLDNRGLGVDGEGEARLVWQGRDLVDLTGRFGNGFLLGLDPLAVNRGALGLELEGRQVAWVDTYGFHTDLATFGTGLVPDRLPLPVESVAYLQLREGGQLLVETDTLPEGLRVRSRAGVPLPLVFPALALDGGPAPQVDVEVDLILGGRLGSEVIGGTVTAILDPDTDPAFDLSRTGIPFRILEMAYDNPVGAEYRWSVAGEPVFLGEPVPGATGSLTLDEGGLLAGLLTIPSQGSTTFVNGSDVFTFAHRSIVADFNTRLPQGDGSWSVAAEGDITLALDVGGATRATDAELQAAATLLADPAGVRFTRIDAQATAAPVYFEVGPVGVGISDLAIPTLTYSPDTGWDFEVTFDATLRFAELGGLTLDPLKGLRLTPGGFTIPALEFTGFAGGDFGGGVFDFDGFRITPLALRLPSLDIDLFSDSDPWNLGGGGWDLAFDLSLGFGSEAVVRWPQLEGFSLTALDVSWGDGGFLGTFEPRLLLEPFTFDLAGNGLSLELFEFSGGLGSTDGLPDIDLFAGGRLILPEELRCANGDPAVTLPGTDLEVFGTAGFGGRFEDAVLNCPFQWGPLELALTDADLVFAFTEDVQLVNLFADALLTVQGTAPNTTVSASGELGIALLEPEIIQGSIALNQPFRWDVPGDDPFLSLAVNSAILDSGGFSLDGSGNVLLPGGGTGPGVTFSGLRFNRASDIVGGSATLAAGVAFEALVTQGSVDWSVVDPASAWGTEQGFRLDLNGAATLSPSGLALAGTANGRLNVQDSVFSTVGVDFTGGFTLSESDARIVGGRAGFDVGGVEVAYATAQGFFPGDIFGAAPLPARIPLPREEVAYLQIRDPVTNDPLIQSASDGAGVSLSTRSNETVELVLPSVPAPGGGPTRIQVTFNAVANPVSYALVSGSVEAVASGDNDLFDLLGLDLPLEVSRIAYDTNRPEGPVMDVRIMFPDGMDDPGLSVSLPGLLVTEDGLVGEALFGSYDPEYTGGALAEADLGQVTFSLDGVRLLFGENQEVQLAGGLASPFFQAADGTRPRLGFDGSLSADGTLALTPDLNTLSGGELPIGEALFELRAIGQTPPVAVTADDQEFSVAVTGILTAPTIAPTLALTIVGLEVGTNGIVVPDLELVAQDQQVELFGSTLTLRTTPFGPGLSLALRNQELLLAMNGDMDFLGHTVQFRGLQVGTSGTLGMVAADIMGDPVELVPDVVQLTRLAVINRSLRAEMAVDLPEPFDDAGRQDIAITVASDGTVAGDGRVVFIDETPGLGGGRTQFNGAVATAHLRYLALRVEPGTSDAGGVELVGDFYVDNQASKRIALGSRTNNSVTPGLAIDFDGDVRWGTARVAAPFTFDADILRLTVESATWSGGPSDFEIGLTGELSVALPAVTGALSFQDVRFGPSLGIDASLASVRGGNLAVGGILTASVSGFEYSDTPTTISGVQGGALPVAQGDAVSQESRDVAVASYVRFGGTLGVGGSCPGECLFRGGVEDFLFYTTPPADGGNTSLIIREASLGVADLLDLEVDLVYREKTGGGIELAMGGATEFLSSELSVVAAVETPGSGSGDQMRAGLFLLASQRVDLVPGVLALTELGGGFFYRIKPEWCTWVRDRAGVPGQCAEEQGKFTAFLAAQAAIVVPEVARANVLLQVSERQLELQGQMAILEPNRDRPALESPINGMAELVIGLQDPYATGSMMINLDYGPLIETNGDGAGVEFFVYGSDAWGVYGGGSVTFLTMATGRADFYVGNEGFYVGGGLEASLDVGIISARAAAETAVWALQSKGWGAYLKVEAEAEFVLGLASIEADLIGGLVSAPDEPILVFATAGAEICAFWGLACADEYVWLEYQNGFSAGRGRRTKYDDLIADAKTFKQDIENAADSFQDRMTAAELQVDFGLDDAELAAVYNRMRDGNLQQTFADAIADEQAAYPASVKTSAFETDLWQPERQYYEFYRDLVAQLNSPVANLATPLDTYYDRAAQGINELAANGPLVQTRLSQALGTIEELEEAVALSVFDNPVTFDGADVQSLENPDGSRTLTSGPSLDLDEAAADEMVDEFRAEQARIDAYAAEVARRIEQVEQSLAYVDLLFSNNRVSYPLGFARRYAEVLQAIEEQYARHGDLLLRQQDWLDAGLASLQARESQARGFVGVKSLALQTVNDRAALDNLIRVRAENLDDLGESTFLADYMAQAETREARPDLYTMDQARADADTLGIQFWYHAARAGMAQASAAATVAFDSLRALANQDLRDRWLDHAGFSTALDEVYQARAGLAQTLLDLYREYAAAYPNTTIPVVTDGQSLSWLADSELQSALQNAQRARTAINLFNRIQQLEQELQVPVVDRVRVMSRNLGYMAEEVYFWTGTHPSGIDEYSYNSLSGNQGVFIGHLGMQSNGRGTGRVGYRLTPGRGTTSESRVLRAGARGGAGYVGYGSAPYQVRYEGGEGGQGVGEQEFWSEVLDDTPPNRPRVRIGSNRSTDVVHWMSQGEQLDSVSWHAWDFDGGVAGYEYAVGWDTDTTGIRDWTPMGGRTETRLVGLGLDPAGPPPPPASGGGGISLDVTSPFFTLPAVSPAELVDVSELEPWGYRVYVRAFNSQGLPSPTGRSAPIRVDQTPPTFPADAVLRPPFRGTLLFSPLLHLGATAAPACEPPPITTGLFGGPILPAFSLNAVDLTAIEEPEPEPAVVTLQIPQALDVGSGVAKYAWRVSRAPAESYSPGGWFESQGVADTLRIEGTPLNYTDEFYVSLVAIDGVGLISEPIHYGPFRAPDASAPVGASFCVEPASGNRLRMRVSGRGFDPETDVVSWSYRVIAADGTVLRNWPSTPDLTSLRGGQTITTEVLPSAGGQEVYAEIRVFNGWGGVTDTRSGPVRLTGGGG